MVRLFRKAQQYSTYSLRLSRKLRNKNPIDKDFSVCQSLVNVASRLKRIIETEIEATTCNRTKKLSIFDQRVETRIYA